MDNYILETEIDDIKVYRYRDTDWDDLRYVFVKNNVVIKELTVSYERYEICGKYEQDLTVYFN